MWGLDNGPTSWWGQDDCLIDEAGNTDVLSGEKWKWKKSPGLNTHARWAPGELNMPRKAKLYLS